MAKAKTSAAIPTATEQEMLDVLERHYASPGSPEYAFLRQVRNSSGYDATRTFDAVVVGLWPSRGHDIHAIEVKVHRGDWLRELKDPKKADDAAKIADRFSVAAPRGIVSKDEVPPMWGYIEVSGGVEEFFESAPLWEGAPATTIRRVTGRKVRTVRTAPLLHGAEKVRDPVPRSLLVPMLRAAGAAPPAVAPEQVIIDAAVRAAVEANAKKWQAALDEQRKREDQKLRDLAEFQRRAGIRWHTPEQMREVARRVQSALAASKPSRIADILQEVGRDLAEAQRAVEKALGHMATGQPEGHTAT